MATASGPNTTLSFLVELVGWRDRRGRFSKVSEDIQKAQSVALRESMDLVLGVAKLKTPVSVPHEGEPEKEHMRDKWEIRFVSAPAESYGAAELVNTAKWATFVFEPTAPHDIVAKNAQALRFWDKQGNIVFRRQVHHPGTKGNDILSAVQRETRVGLVAALNKSAASVVTAIQQVFS